MLLDEFIDRGEERSLVRGSALQVFDELRDGSSFVGREAFDDGCEVLRGRTGLGLIIASNSRAAREGLGQARNVAAVFERAANGVGGFVCAA